LIIFELERRLLAALKTKKEAAIKYGCDLAVFFIANNKDVYLSSGNTPVMVFDGSHFNRIKGQKIYVGEGRIVNKEDVNTLFIPANPNHAFYVASDGLYDQCGGERGIPYSNKEIKKIITTHHGAEMNQITDKIWEAFCQYKGNQMQRDDVTMIAFKP
jgi:serine phosphatase RsbU (regulator of sigma subunit)